ncbi:hypothetical protein WOLCODRAFT_155978 [Wolfiporia cocos MD-104 SS10]|uniref:Retrotransposon gag domain-containing protein n=1 Tax=Wolfiporia cocos (strain MD-104) TaxID=742152 RepID=A0A2H3JH02_WOLCO|nr:hypothetical protein WOLCODRAFT_155978 [Wolfiporia cocos MD-104 SS10]
MQRFDLDLLTRLIKLLPEAYRRIFYEEKYDWRDPPTGFFMKGGYLTIPSPDKLSPTWVQVPPSLIDPWDQTHTTFEWFGTVTDIMTPTLTIHRADGQQQMNTPPTGGTMGVAGATMGGSTLPGSGSMGQTLLAEQTPLEQDLLEEEAFLEGEVPQRAESFKNDCNTWFTMFTTDYQSDNQKILFIMSYIQGSDRVNQWKENYYAKYTDPVTRAFMLPLLAQFSAEFNAAFELIEEKQKTNDDLFNIKQDKKSIDDFNIEFDNWSVRNANMARYGVLP